MSRCVYSAEHQPDVFDAVDLLAFLLCPLQVFVHSGNPDRCEAVSRLVQCARAKALRRWHLQYVNGLSN